MPIPLLPVLGAIAEFVVANGGRVAVRKYGAKAVEKARKQITKRQKAIDDNVRKLKAKGEPAGKQSKLRKAEIAETKTVNARNKILKKESKELTDALNPPKLEKPLKFTKGGRVAKSSGGSVSSRLSKSGPVAKPN